MTKPEPYDIFHINVGFAGAALQNRLEAYTGAKWVVESKIDNLDFQFMCRQGDYKRLSPSYGFTDLASKGQEQIVDDAAVTIGHIVENSRAARCAND